jgi:hypothetical protein
VYNEVIQITLKQMDPNKIADLLEGSDDIDGAEILRRDSNGEVEGALINGLRELKGEARKEVIDSLKGMRSSRVLRALFEQMGKEEGGREEDILKGWEGEEFEACVREKMKSADDGLRWRLVSLVRWHSNIAFRREILLDRLTNDDSIRVRAWAARYLGMLPEKDADVRATLVETLLDDVGVYSNAREGRESEECLRDESMVERVIQMLDNDEVTKVGQYEGAVRFLAQSPIEAATSCLSRAFYNTSTRMKATVLYALKGKIDDESLRSLRDSLEPAELADFEAKELADERGREYSPPDRDKIKAETQRKELEELEAEIEKLGSAERHTKLHGLRRIVYLAYADGTFEEKTEKRAEETLRKMSEEQLVDLLIGNYDELERLHDEEAREREAYREDAVDQEIDLNFTFSRLGEAEMIGRAMRGTLSDEALVDSLFGGLSQPAQERLASSLTGPFRPQDQLYNDLEEQFLLEEMGRHNDPRTTAVLIRAVNNDRFDDEGSKVDRHTKQCALRGLANREGSEVAAAIIQALQDDNEEVRVCALKALEDRDGESVLGAVKDALKDEGMKVRIEAARILILRNEKKAVAETIRGVGQRFATEVSIVLSRMAQEEDRTE